MAEFLRRGRPLGLAKAPSSRARSSPTCAATWPCWTPKRSIWGQLPRFRVGRLPSGRTASAPRHGHRPVQQARRPGRGQADSIARREAHLRHDRSFDAGVDPKIVADRIGHANAAYTLAIYTTSRPGRTGARPKPWPGCCSAPGGRARSARPSTSVPRPRAGSAQHAKLADLSGVCYPQ
jgi:hypothetical protein